MHWYQLLIHFAVNIKYSSGSAYRVMWENGIISLPPERTLRDYTHWVSIEAGFLVSYVCVSVCVCVCVCVCHEMFQWSLMVVLNVVNREGPGAWVAHARYSCVDSQQPLTAVSLVSVLGKSTANTPPSSMSNPNPLGEEDPPSRS